MSDRNTLKKHKVFIGFDSRQTLAYDVAAFSFKNNAKQPEKLQVIPLQIDHKDITAILSNRPLEKRGDEYWDPISQAPQSTEFSISRFCVPKLTKGWALFVDSDVISMCDVEEIFSYRNPEYAVQVVKHDYKPKDLDHGGDKHQMSFPRKNWASVILWNCDHPAHANLTYAMLNSLPGRDLHAFCWLQDLEIGTLPDHCNWLVNENGYEASVEDLAKASILHYTLGGPWQKNWSAQPSDLHWNEAYKAMIAGKYGARLGSISQMKKDGRPRPENQGQPFLKRAWRLVKRIFKK